MPDIKADSAPVVGLTTAAGLWLTAAIGVAVGLGRELTAILSTGLAWVILSVLLKFEGSSKNGRVD